MMVFFLRAYYFFWFGRRVVITIVSGDRIMVSNRL